MPEPHLTTGFVDSCQQDICRGSFLTYATPSMACFMQVMREKGEELRGAVEEWQDKRSVPEPRLTTGFLDGIQPIVDSYELKVQAQRTVLHSS